MNRRYFLTGVAAGVTAALAGTGKPELFCGSKSDIRTYGNFKIGMDVGSDGVCLVTARQQGETLWITEWMNQHVEVDEHGVLRLKPEIEGQIHHIKTVLDRDARITLLDLA